MAIDRKVLFNGLRQSPFPNKLTTAQVGGMTAILDAWDASGLTDARDLAYILATPIVETGWTMQPIRELGGKAYFTKRYDKTGNPKKAKVLGNTEVGDGAKFCGRGFVQATGRGNARKLTKLVKEIFNDDVNFEEDPDELLQPKYAAMAIVVGLSRGIFTGKKLSDYLRSAPPNWKGARYTVNDQDRAEELAGYAKQIYADLLSAGA